MNAAAFSFPVQALQTLLQVRFDIQHPIWISSIISRLHLNVIYHLLDTLQDSADSRGLAYRGFGELMMLLQVVFSGIAYLGHSRVQPGLFQALHSRGRQPPHPRVDDVRAIGMDGNGIDFDGGYIPRQVKPRDSIVARLEDLTPVRACIQNRRVARREPQAGHVEGCQPVVGRNSRDLRG